MKSRQARDMQIGVKHTMKNGSELIVTGYENAMRVSVEFLSTGYTTMAQASHIRIGSVVDKMAPTVYGVGFIGDGKFKPSKNGRNTIAYDRWNNMLQRCYSDKYHKSRPTYMDCTVCDDWHNFQNFAEWFYSNYPNDGESYQLDKDFIVKGNRIYSPETCCFLTQDENTSIAHERSYLFKSPEGDIVEITNLKSFCSKNGINRSGMSMLACGGLKKYKGWTFVDKL